MDKDKITKEELDCALKVIKDERDWKPEKTQNEDFQNYTEKAVEVINQYKKQNELPNNNQKER